MICTHEQTAQDFGKQREPNNAKEFCGGRNAATKNNTTIHHHTTTEINSNDEAQQRRRMQRSDGRDVTRQRRMQRKSEGNVEAAEGKNGILFFVQQKSGIYKFLNLKKKILGLPFFFSVEKKKGNINFLNTYLRTEGECTFFF